VAASKRGTRVADSTERRYPLGRGPIHNRSPSWGRDAGLSMPEREHAFLHTLQRNARGGSVSSPQAKLRHELGACARILSGIFSLAFKLTVHRVIPIWFLVFLTPCGLTAVCAMSRGLDLSVRAVKCVEDL